MLQLSGIVGLLLMVFPVAYFFFRVSRHRVGNESEGVAAGCGATLAAGAFVWIPQGFILVSVWSLRNSEFLGAVAGAIAGTLIAHYLAKGLVN